MIDAADSAFLIRYLSLEGILVQKRPYDRIHFWLTHLLERFTILPVAVLTYQRTGTRRELYGAMFVGLIMDVQPISVGMAKHIFFKSKQTSPQFHVSTCL